MTAERQTVTIRGEELAVVRKGGILVINRSGHQPKPTALDCQHRGELLGTIDCGCGSANRDTEVFKCELFIACTLTALGGKAGWNKIELKQKPKCCRCCSPKMREDAIAERDERTATNPQAAALAAFTEPLTPAGTA